MRMKRCIKRGHVCVCLAIGLFCALNVHAKIVFSAKQKHLGEKFYHIYAMEDDGSNLRRITPTHRYNIIYYRMPRWLPDGKRIVFQRDWREGKLNKGKILRRELFIIDETGRNEHSFIVDPHRTDTRPAPSPDGRSIAFDSLRMGTLDIYLYDLARDKLTALTNNRVEGGFTRAPSWSPDGSRIVYQNGEAIWITDADGGRKKEIVPETWNPVFLTSRDWMCWSPSGKYILYSEDRYERSETLSVPFYCS